VSTIATARSSASARATACFSSSVMRFVIAFSRSGRSKVMVAIGFSTS